MRVSRAVKSSSKREDCKSGKGVRDDLGVKMGVVSDGVRLPGAKGSDCDRVTGLERGRSVTVRSARQRWLLIGSGVGEGWGIGEFGGLRPHG